MSLKRKDTRYPSDDVFKRDVQTELERMVSSQPGKGHVLALAQLHPDFKKISGYVIRNSGKKFRPLVLYAIAREYGVPYRNIVYYSAAVEKVHNWTLPPDDCPCMDDQGERRGRAAVHVEFASPRGVSKDPGTARVFLGSYNSFDIVEAHIRHGPVQGKKKDRIADEVALGKFNVESGQYYDLFETHKFDSLGDFERLASLKTGGLYGTAAALGAVLGDEDEDKVDIVRNVGVIIGTAFQLRDDLLDWGGDEGTVGKPLRVDKRDGGKTVFDVADPGEVYHRALKCETEAIALLDSLNERSFQGLKGMLSEMDASFEKAMLRDKLEQLKQVASS